MTYKIALQEFSSAMYKRFGLLDVLKAQKAAKGKDAKEKLEIRNELKIITAPDDVYNLWSEVISSAVHGELIDPNTRLKYNEKATWKPEQGNLTHEFFKVLGNLSFNDLSKLAEHILHQNPGSKNKDYPKVTIKLLSVVQESCYTAREWVERRKRKHKVKMELHALDASLRLMSSLNKLNHEKWREFKRSRNFTSATMNVLLEQPGNEYWMEAKQSRAKGKSAEEMSMYAAEFFRVFLQQRNNFVPPKSTAYYRPYDVMYKTHQDWPRGVLTAENVKDIKLGVWDLR